MSTYEEWFAAQQQRRALEDQEIKAQLTEQGYGRTVEASPKFIKWAAIVFVVLCIGVFLGPAALIAALFAAAVIVWIF